MALSAFALFSTIAAVEGGTLAVTWEDCGAKHATVTDLQPTTITTGTTETLIGTGTVDEDVTAAHITMTIKAGGVQLASCEGDGTAEISCALPLGVGAVSLKALSYPIEKGDTDISVDVKTAPTIPVSLAKVDVEIRVTEQNGEDVVCLNVHTAKKLATVEDVDCSTATCVDHCQCYLDQCASQIAACLEQPRCAAGQDCAFQCACGDTACALGCAAKNPSAKAMPVALCGISKCNKGDVSV